MSLPPGTRFGPYEIQSEIGAGGMGEVYKALDTRLDRTVAIKVLPPDVSAEPERRARFEREAKTVAGLSHPHICLLFDVGCHEGQMFLVMEHLVGQTLAERLEKGALPLDQALTVATEIAAALSAAHRRGIIHRDLKPANVMLTKSGAKLLDFGLARLSEPAGGLATSTTLSAVQTIEGTLPYMAPEQVEGRRTDARTDLFAFGATLYEMVTGRRVFQGESAASVMAAILDYTPAAASTLAPLTPPGLDRLIKRCLAKSPDDRPDTAHDLADELRWVAETASNAVPSVMAGAAPPAATRTLRRWVVALLVVAAAAAAAVAYTVGRRTATQPVPSFQRLTFRRGWVNAARFAPDGQTVIYSAEWDGGPNEVFSLRIGSAESRPLGGHSPAELLAVSSTSELALSLDSHARRHPVSWAGTLATVPFSGGTPRPLDERITFADWAPNGTDLAIVRETDTADQLEYPVGKVLYTAGGGVSYPRVAPTGDTVAFLDSATQFTGTAVATVDRAGNKRTLTGTYPSVMGLTWSPASDEVWFTAATPGGRHELRAVTLDGRERLVLRGPLSMRLLDVAKDGRMLVAQDQFPCRCFVRTEKDVSDRELSWLSSSGIDSLSRDGRFVVLSETGEGMGAADDFVSYIRETTGTPPMKLGPGTAFFVSHDERFVVGSVRRPRPALVIRPVGAGQTRTIPVEGVNLINVWGLLPDGRTAVITGNEPPHGIRIWLMDVQGGKPRAITPEGVDALRPLPITPDGSYVLGVSGAMVNGKTLAYPVAGGEARPWIGLPDGEQIAGWDPGGRWYFRYRPNVVPLKMYRADAATGARTLVRETVPADRAGRLLAMWALTTPDGKTTVYSTAFWQSELHLVEGLK